MKHLKLLGILSAAVMLFSAAAPLNCYGADEQISENTVQGDVSGDGKFDIRDAAFLANRLANGKESELSSKGDFNWDGSVNIRDSASMAKHLAKASALESTLPEGISPLSKKPTSDNLVIKTDEAKDLYSRIKNNDYPEVSELKNSNVVKQLDALSKYYKELYGNTADINTAARQNLRDEIMSKFLSKGSARTSSVDMTTGSRTYVYDGELSKDYKMELVLGLPAAGKSSKIVDPDSEEMKAFILDSDIVKELIPEFRDTYGCAADAVHEESSQLNKQAIQAFLTGELKGTNVIIPKIGDNYDKIMNDLIIPFEEAGYSVTVKFVECEVKASMARNVMRELETGRIINSELVFDYGTKPLEAYKKIASMKNKDGIPYGATVLSEETEEKKAA